MCGKIKKFTVVKVTSDNRRVRLWIEVMEQRRYGNDSIPGHTCTDSIVWEQTYASLQPADKKFPFIDHLRWESVVKIDKELLMAK